MGPDTNSAIEKALTEKTSKPADQSIDLDQPSIILGPTEPPVIVGTEESDPVSDVKVPYNKLQIRELRYGMEGYDVKLAQAALQCWGYSIVTTGIFGKEMDEKIRQFQDAKGYTVDGEIGEETWKELLKV